LKSAGRVTAARGESEGLLMRAEAGRLHQANLDWLTALPGVRDVEMFCNWKHRPFSADALKFLRAELYVTGGIHPATVDAMTIPDVAARLRAVLAPPTEPPKSPSPKPAKKARRDKKTEARDKWIYQ